LRADPRTKDMGILVLTARGQKVDKEAALAAGADGHIAKPVKMEELLVEVEALLARKKAGSKSPPQAPPQPLPQPPPQPSQPRQAKIMFLPIFSLKGGVGVTTLAINLAVLLQKIAPTVLLDLSPNTGHCATCLGVRPERHWGQYLDNPNLKVAPLLLEHSSGLRLFSAPPVLYQQGWFSDGDIESVLEQLETQARFVVIDMPPVFNSVAKFIFTQAYRIVLVSGDDLPSIQTTRATLLATQEWIERMLLVRNTGTPGQHPPLEALHQALRVRGIIDIPYDPSQEGALRQNTTLVEADPNSPLVNGLKRVAQVILAR